VVVGNLYRPLALKLNRYKRRPLAARIRLAVAGNRLAYMH
jgi:hypothetical protein